MGLGSVCGVRVAGVGAALPQRVVSSTEVEDLIDIERFGFERGWLERVTGVQTRRWAEPDERPSGLAATAAREALTAADIEPAALDVVIFTGITRDFLEPATANVVQAELGACHARVFDLTNACNGFVDGLDVADALIRSGKARRVLVTTGERASLCINWHPASSEEFLRSVAGYVVSDGGGAAVVEACEDPGRGIRGRAFRSDGAHWPLAVGGRIRPPAEACEACGSPLDHRFLCDGRPLFEAVFRLLPETMGHAVAASGWTFDDVDLVFLHEASRRFVASGLDALGTREHPGARIWSTVERYGNTSTASLPLAMTEASRAGALVPGKHVLLLGGAAGVSVAAMTLVW